MVCTKIMPGLTCAGNTHDIDKFKMYFKGEAAVLKRRERRIWEEKRAKLLFDYQQFSYYGPPTAWLMFELAWKMSQVRIALLKDNAVIPDRQSFYKWPKFLAFKAWLCRERNSRTKGPKSHRSDKTNN